MIISRLISPTVRVVFGLVAIAVCSVLLAAFFQIFPDRQAQEFKSRRQLCETLALQFSVLAANDSLESLEYHFDAAAGRNEAINVIRLQPLSVQLDQNVSDAASVAINKTEDGATGMTIGLPFYQDDQCLGIIEFEFKPIAQSKFGWLFTHPDYVLTGFVAFIVSMAIYLYLRYVFRSLNPSKMIPASVRQALDTLAEGLLVIDNNQKIVLANRAFVEATGKSIDKLLGQPASSLEFVCQEEDGSPDSRKLPWLRTLKTGEKIRGSILGLTTSPNRSATYSVSCSPVLDDVGEQRGVLVSFEDVTQFENKKEELKNMVLQLDASTTEIKRQNKELEILATRDALTGCMNRRSFFKRFDREFSEAVASRSELSACMVDIDHFKSINDNHGHATGDLVLQTVSSEIESTIREADAVCRYGGEEFAILLPGANIDQASRVAEDIRLKLAALQFRNLQVTASIGVSGLSQSPECPQDLLEQADKCLYFAKRNGRNQVIRWDLAAEKILEDEADDSSHARSYEETLARIPFQAVTALISALAYRDQETANHCRRVADLCVAIGEDLLPMKDCYTLEIAGLLHDIGKVSVPDSILLKPSELTKEEWRSMRLHEQLGVELLRTSFECEELDAIVSNYRIPYNEIKQVGHAVPTGARILHIVDAFDAMTSKKRYRAAMSQEDAFAELRRCSGQQFDPEIVEHAIEVLSIRGSKLSDNDERASNSTALEIGLQIQRLAESLENNDTQQIAAIATRLQATAIKQGKQQLAEKASEISSEINDDCEHYEMIRRTNELIDLCRAAQGSRFSHKTIEV